MKKYLTFLLASCLAFLLVVPPLEIKASEDTATIVAEQELYHVHSGNSSSGGGCYYNPVYRTETYRTTCNGVINWQTNIDTYTGRPVAVGSCPRCGASFMNSVTAQYSPSQCDALTGTGTRQVLSGYSMACNAGSNEYMGKIGLAVDSTDWATNINLECKMIDGGDNINSISYAWSNGDASRISNITANGNYSVTMRYKSHASQTEQVTLSYEVQNIDTVAPTADVVYDDTAWAVTKIVEIQNAADSQVGLDDKPYRYLDVSTGTYSEWGTNNVFELTENGNYTFEVRDKLGNTFSETITINHIDHTGPETGELVYDDTDWAEYKTIDVINTSDTQSGMHAVPYRIYDGTVWSEWGNVPTFKITKNGTYTVAFRDAVGNETTRNATFAHIDDVPPTADAVYNDAVWTTRKTIKIQNASDVGIGLHEYPYRFFNDTSWSGWTNRTEYEVSENGEYKVQVRDKMGNFCTIDCPVNKIDYTAPSVVINCDTITWEADKTIKIVTAEDTQSGLHATPYRFYDGKSWSVWGTTSQWKISKNGVYKVEVRDAIGNIYAEDIAISRIDENGLTVHVTSSPTGWSKDPVEIIISAYAKCGLANKPYSYDGGKTWTSENTYKVSSTGTYTIQIKDSAERIVKKNVVVTNIDTSGPSIQRVSAESVEGSNVKVTVIASDSQSGLAPTAYSFDGGKTWVPENTYTMEEKTKITVYVRDAVGNTSMQTIDYVPPVTEIVQEEEPEEKNVETYIREIEEDAEVIILSAAPQITSDESEPISVVTIEEESTPLMDFAAATAATTGGGISIFFIIFWIVRTCKVYNVMPDKATKYLGRARIRKAVGGYEVIIPKRMIDKSYSNHMRILFPKKFAEKQVGEVLEVKTKADSEITQEDKVVLDSVDIKVKFTGIS